MPNMSPTGKLSAAPPRNTSSLLKSSMSAKPPPISTLPLMSETAGRAVGVSISAAMETLPYMPAAIVPLSRKAALFIEIVIEYHPANLGRTTRLLLDSPIYTRQSIGRQSENRHIPKFPPPCCQNATLLKEWPVRLEYPHEPDGF